MLTDMGMTTTTGMTMLTEAGCCLLIPTSAYALNKYRETPDLQRRISPDNGTTDPSVTHIRYSSPDLRPNG